MSANQSSESDARLDDLRRFASTDSWNKACLKYFKAKYLQRLQRSHWANEPFNEIFKVPSDPIEARYQLPGGITKDAIMPNLLNDRLFYLAFFVMESSKIRHDSYDRFLWEIFGTNPGSLLEFCVTARSHGHLLYPGKSPVEAYLNSMGLERPASFESFLDSVNNCLATSKQILSFKTTLQQLKERLLELQQEFTKYDLGAVWKQSGFRWVSGLVHKYPLYNGLQQYLKINGILLEQVLQHSLDQLSPLDGFSMQTFPSFPPLPKPGSILFPESATLYFDTAGTGKTTAILDRVRKSFGFYCVSPNLLPSDMETSNSEIAPDRAWASRDTYSVYDDFKALEMLNLSSYRGPNALEPGIFPHGYQRSEPMDAARYHLLGIYKKMEGPRSGDEQDSQKKWLQLQLTCWLGNDPFDVAYRFIRLQSMTEIDMKLSLRNMHQESLWAFDEVQQILGDPLATAIMIEALLRNEINRTICIFSGTSLELQKMEIFLKSNVFVQLTNVYKGKSQNNYVLDEAKFLEVMRVHARNIVNELHALRTHGIGERLKTFPLLSRGGRSLGFTVQLPQGSQEEVEEALEEWHVLKSATATDEQQSEEFKDFLKQVKKDHTTLVGRIRWATLFAEELLRNPPAETDNPPAEEGQPPVGKGKLTAQDVERAAQRAAKRIKQSLKDRIHQYKDTDWVNELFWTVILADVFSMTRIFSEEQSAKLISEGFALIDEIKKIPIKEGGGRRERTITKGSLREPLAMKAVMEYLRDPQNNGLYDKLLNRFFNTLQLDRGQGGALGKLAEYVFTAKMDNFLRDTSDEIAVHRRNQFINILKNAEGKHSGDTVLNKISDIERYFLVDPDLHQNPDEKISTHYWLSHPRSSNFFFPHPEDGPDLLVFLKIPNTRKRILCALQFKTGNPAPGENSYIRHALHTLALKPWKPPKFRGPVIHIYVANAVDIDTSKFHACLEWKFEEARVEEEKAEGEKAEGGKAEGGKAKGGKAEEEKVEGKKVKGEKFEEEKPKEEKVEGEKQWDRAKLRDDDFICFMDRERSKNVWGETFETLLELMKNLRPRRSMGAPA